MFGALDNVLDVSAKGIAGDKAQTQELKRLSTWHKSREASEQTLIENSRTFLDSKLTRSDAHRAAKDVFAASTKSNPAIKNSLGNAS